MSKDKQGNGKVIGAVAGGVLGMIGNRIAQNRQQRNQRELNEQGQELGMKTWNETNYKAQMGQMRQAGLNPSLMYGKGGAGGATVASPSGGAAPQAKQMDIGQTAEQGALLASQIKLNIATANKNQSDADLTADGKTKGQDLQNIGTNLDNELKEIEVNVQGETQEDQITAIQAASGKAVEEYEREAIAKNIDEATQKTEIVRLKAESLTAVIGVALANSQLNVNTQKIEESKAQMNKWAQEIYIKGEQLKINKADVTKKIKEFFLKEQIDTGKLDKGWTDTAISAISSVIIKFLTKGKI